MIIRSTVLKYVEGHGFITISHFTKIILKKNERREDYFNLIKKILWYFLYIFFKNDLETWRNQFRILNWQKFWTWFFVFFGINFEYWINWGLGIIWPKSMKANVLWMEEFFYSKRCDWRKSDIYDNALNRMFRFVLEKKWVGHNNLIRR